LYVSRCLPNDGITWRVRLVSDGREEEEKEKEKEQVLDLEPDWATPSYGLEVGERFGLKMHSLLAIRRLYSRLTTNTSHNRYLHY
jgi:hypothetical protein